MAETTQFTIGADVRCSDGICGEVTRVVVDPLMRVVTHLAVEPKHRRGLARLVPVDLVQDTSGTVGLRCTTKEFENLDAAEETEFLTGIGGYTGYDPGQVLAWPYFGLGSGLGVGGVSGLGTGNFAQPLTYDTVPLGEVAIRRGEHVHACDGDIGRVRGLVVDQRHRVTHVLLQEGHLWGRKEVAIPIGAVVGVGAGIRITMTKHEVQELPPIPIDAPDREQ